MKLVYLAGPMSGLPEFNYPAFNQAAEQLRSLGFSVENPAENDLPKDSAWSVYMRVALRQLLLCAGIVLLPGWEHSRGARLELKVANALNMPVYKLADLLGGA